MSFQPGSSILGRFVIEAPLPAQGDLLRFLAQDTATQETVIIHTPAPVVRLRPGAMAHFKAATSPQPSHASRAAPILQGQHSKNPFAVYAQYAPLSFEDPLPVAELAGLASSLLDAVSHAHSITNGGVRKKDVVIRADGTPALQPCGIVEKKSMAVPDPTVAPGDGDTLDGALYGVGLLLFEAATGQPPFDVKTMSALHNQQQSPPNPRDLRPDLPEALNTCIANLLSPQPATRRQAVNALQHTTPPRLNVNFEEAIPVSAPTPLKRSRPRQTTTIVLPKWVVLADLSKVPHTLRRRLASLSQIPDSALEKAAMEGVAVPVGGADSQAAAEALAAQWASSSVPLTVESVHRRRGLLLAGGVLALLSAMLGGVLGGAGLAMLGLSPGLIVPISIVSAMVLLVGLVATMLGAFWKRVRPNIQIGHELMRAQSPQMTDAEMQIDDARRAVLLSQLPAPAQTDLLDVLDELQDALADSDDPSELAYIQNAVVDILHATEQQNESESRTQSIAEDASRKAHAARIASRELR